MSSFYEDASLVMIPSGYKTSKVYCAKPTDGAGDLTFTRSNDTATRVASNGLIEKVRTNLLTYSQDFSNAAWVKSAGATLTHSQTDPNGGTTASRLQMPSGTSNYLAASAITGLTNGGKYTHSIYMKSNTGSTQTVRILDGVRGAAGGSLLASVTTSWQRFEVVITTASTSAGLQIDNAGGAYNNDILIAFAQTEVSDFGATPYIATTSAAVSVGPVANVPRLDYLNSSCPRLLLEPQRTNSITYSEQLNLWTAITGSVSANAAVSPDGYTNADKFVPDNGANALLQQLIVISAATHTFSVFAKDDGITTFSIQSRDNASASNFTTALFDLSSGTVSSTNATGIFSAASGTITNYGNGWYRCTLTFTSSGSTTTRFRFQNDELGDGTKGLLLYGAQAELSASYATSYIPTLVAAVTRGADAASKTGISSLIGQTEGTLFADITLTSRSNFSYFAIAPNLGSTSAYIGIGITLSAISFEVVNSGVQVAYNFPSTSTGRLKLAFAYKANDFVAYVNGALVHTDTSGTVPTCSEIGLNAFNNTASWNCNQALLFKTRLTNSELAALTTL